MKKIIFFALFIIGLFLLGCSSGQSSAPANTNQGAAENSIAIKGFAFSPAEIVVNVGDTVTWANEDNAAHTITSDSGSELASPPLEKDGVYSYTFNEAGTYTYRCSIHRSMQGKVIVHAK